MKQILKDSALSLLLASTSIMADDLEAKVHVINLLTDYMPKLLKFKVDLPLGSCQVDTWIEYSARGDTD